MKFFIRATHPCACLIGSTGMRILAWKTNANVVA